MKIWNNLSKRGLALFLVLTMCVSLLPATALAAELEELNHVHNEDGWVCEEAQGDLTCDIEEHEHADECYAPGELVLSCALTEDEGHTHGDSCYSEEEISTLACGLEESEEHTHSEDCYSITAETVLACGLEESEGHAHDEACFTEGEGALVCETAEHTHDGACYEASWACIAPSKNIQRFLRAVQDIPEEITAEDEGVVIAARQAYDLLTEDELLNPAVVVGLVTLEHAETVLDAVKAETEEPGEGDETLPEEPGLEEPGEEEPTEPETPEIAIPEDATVVTPDLLLKAAYGQTMSVESFFGLVQSSKATGENPPATLTFAVEGLETVFLYEEAAAYTEQITVEEYAILLDGAEATVYAQGEAEAAGGSNALAEVADTTITMMVGESLDLTTINKKGTWQSSYWSDKTDNYIATLDNKILTGVGAGETQIWWREKATSPKATPYTVVVTAARPAIRFDTNGGSGSVEELPFEGKGDEVTLPDGTGLSRSDYEFLGWAERRDVNSVTSETTPGDLRIYAPGEGYVTKTAGLITLYAVWAQNTGSRRGSITAAVRTDGTTPDEPSIRNEEVYCYPISATSVDNILDYFTPAHTVVGPEAVEPRLTPLFHEKVTEGYNAIPDFDPDTQYIEWYVIKCQGESNWHVDGTVKDKAKVSLDYNSNGATEGLAPDGKQYAVGAEVTVAGNTMKPALSKTGYTFDGWNTKANGTGTSYAEGEMIILTENTMLYAQWVPNNSTVYTVAYYLEGLNGMYPAEASSSETKRGRTDSTVTATVKPFDGFTFDSRNSDNVMSGTVAADGSLTLKLYYKRNLYKVTYELAGGTSEAQLVYTDLKYGAATPKIEPPTRTGYTFKGWTPEVAGTVTADATYTARWEVDQTQTKELSYTVEYYKNGVIQAGDTQTETATVQVLGPDTMAVDKTKINTTNKYDGFVFDASEPAPIPDTIANDGVIKVYYVQNNLTVTYTDGVDDKVVFQDQTYPDLRYGADTPEFNGTPIRPGYNFTGWSPALAGTVTADATYVAQWQKDETHTKNLTYTVEYYQNGTLVEDDTETKTLNVWAGTDSGTIEVSTVATADKYGNAWKLSDTPTVPEAVEGKLTVTNGCTIKVYYVPNEAAYTVEYYFDGTPGNAPTKFAETAGGTYSDYTALTGGNAEIGQSKTVEAKQFVQTADGMHYVLKNVVGINSVSVDASQNVVKVYYLKDAIGPDETPDGKPDDCQKMVTFLVEGGYWNDSNNNTAIVTVVDLMKGTELSPDGTGTVTVPNAGQSPDDNHAKGGSWNPTLSAPSYDADTRTLTVSGNAEVTYTFTYSEAADYTVTYHFLDAEGNEIFGNVTVPETWPQTPTGHVAHGSTVDFTSVDTTTLNGQKFILISKPAGTVTINKGEVNNFHV